MKIKKLELLEFVLLTLFVGGLFLSHIASSPFMGDESIWISRSYYFELYFSGRFREIVHDPSPSLAESTPAIPLYLIGFSRWIGGYHTLDLNKAYAYDKSYAQNQAEGNVPSDGLLWWSRLLPSLAGAMSIVVAFYLVRGARNRLAAYIWLLLALVSAFLVSMLDMALSEAPLMLGLVLAGFAGYKAIAAIEQASPDRLRSLVWIGLFGAFAGLAGQSKNNGLAIYLAGIIILVLSAIRAGQDAASRLKFLGMGLLGLSLTTFLFFVGPNPLLWKHPISSSLHLIPYRIGLMERQAALDPDAAIHGWQASLRVVPNEIFAHLTPFGFFGAPYIKFLLAFLGLYVLVLQIWRGWRIGHLQAASLALLAVGMIASVPSLLTTLNWPRYFIVPVFFVTVFMAIGTESLLGLLWSARKRRTDPREAPRPAADGESAGAISDTP